MPSGCLRVGLMYWQSLSSICVVTGREGQEEGGEGKGGERRSGELVERRDRSVSFGTHELPIDLLWCGSGVVKQNTAAISKNSILVMMLGKSPLSLWAWSERTTHFPDSKHQTTPPCQLFRWSGLCSHLCQGQPMQHGGEWRETIIWSAAMFWHRFQGRVWGQCRPNMYWQPLQHKVQTVQTFRLVWGVHCVCVNFWSTTLN